MPVALIASDRSWVEEHFSFRTLPTALMDAHWPGPLAMLLKPKDLERFRNVIHEGLWVFASVAHGCHGTSPQLVEVGWYRPARI